MLASSPLEYSMLYLGHFFCSMNFHRCDVESETSLLLYFFPRPIHERFNLEASENEFLIFVNSYRHLKLLVQI